MTRLLEWLLDLEHIRLARDAPLLFRWEGGLPPWILFALTLAALTAVAATYRVERTTPTRRGILIALRCAIVGLVLAVLCRPTLVLQRNRVESSHVALAVDASMSMAVRDRDGEGKMEPPRIEQVQDALLTDDAAPLRTLLGQNAVQLYQFSGAAESEAFAASLENIESLADALRATKPEGVSTDLAKAIATILEKGQGRRLAAIVLASDGRSTQSGALKDALELAAGRQVPIFPIRVGSTEPIRDVEVGPLRAQDGVFVNDLLAVEAQLSARGLTEPTRVTVHLVEDRTGAVVAEESVVLETGDATATVELRAKPSAPGVARYRVEVPPLPGENNLENNVDRVDVTVLDGGLRVLFVEGYPRYEYRYLKNALLREPTMQMSVLLLEADEQFIQEGTEPIRRFPDSPEELNRFDVVVFGDVDPRGGWLTTSQMNLLLDFVGNEGGGFGLIAGERSAPQRFLGTPLEKLIPVIIDPAFSGRYDAPLTTGFGPRLTADGRRSRIFRFSAERERNEELLDGLPELYWFARTLGPRPGATVLLEHPTVRAENGSMPLLVTGRYGAGKLLFQATDDTWRWRRLSGELLHDSFWVHAMRELRRESRGSRDRRYTLQTDRRTYAYGSSVRVRIELLDPQLLSDHREGVEVTVFDRGASDETPVTRVEASPIGPVSRVFEGSFVPDRPGGFSIQATGIVTPPDERVSSAEVRVERPDLEARRPEADFEALDRIAAATGGRVLDLDNLAEAFTAIRDRSVQIPDDIVEPLWDSKLILILFVSMISLEWGLRKAFGLL